MITEEKQRLREQMKAMGAGWSRTGNASPASSLVDSEIWKNASSVLLYSAIGTEADTSLLLSTAEGRSILFPKISGESLDLYRMIPESRWIHGRFGIAEPDPKNWEPFRASDVALALVPGLAFDLHGGRLGRGRGFYDRLLREGLFRGIKVGYAWDWQLVDQVPCEQHDIRMDYIVTERKLLQVGSGLDKPAERG
jgi:5-formyltetrahydrofolate cyclo-ligase